VLDTGWGDGSGFLRYMAQWLADDPGAATLHYVGIADQQPDGGWAPALRDALGAPGPGFHRFALGAGRVSLTLCIGPLQTMLGEQVMQADTVFLKRSDLAWDRWATKALAKCCATGAQVEIDADWVLPEGLENALAEAGFALRAASLNSARSCIYAPRWQVRKRSGVARAVTPPQHCAVIGAGLAGASVANALARRGWRVDVYDENTHSAAGASGLPLGLVVPHFSADDSPRSRLSRSGVRLMMAQAAQLLREGEDWAPSGVLEQRSAPLKPHWHAQAGWIKPATLVQAWLKHPAIRFHGNTRVHALQQADSGWALQSPDGQQLASATHVVFANAFGCQALLRAVGMDVSLQQVHGTLSFGPQSQLRTVVCPVAPVNGNGCFVHSIPGEQGLHWYAGASFETDAGCIADTPAQHLGNHQRLRDLVPAVAEALSAAFEKSAVAAWSGTRCVTRDRMPMVGSLLQEAGNTLWISAGMGSRGLSFSALCAELLASQMCAEPLPVESSLVRSLHVNRMWRRSR